MNKQKNIKNILLFIIMTRDFYFLKYSSLMYEENIAQHINIASIHPWNCRVLRTRPAISKI